MKIIYKALCILILINIILPSFVHAAPPAPGIDAESAILVDSKRGQILYEKQSDEKLHISTACKIMTALIAIEKTELDAKITISKESADTEGSKLNLEVGEKYTVENLLYAILPENKNDAANALAEFIGGDIPSFVDIMNDYANKLNLKNTHFRNPTGLYDEGQYTTAYDLSVLIRHALSNTTFNRIFATQAKPWFDKNGTQLLVNQNKLFLSYEGVDGGKVGYNDPTQHTYITTATKNDLRLICIVLNSPELSVSENSTRLLDYGFKNFKTGKLVSSGQPFDSINIQGIDVNLISVTDVFYTYPIGENYISDFKTTHLDNINIPIYKKDVLGKAKYTLNDGTIIDIDLFPDKEILPEETLSSKVKKKLLENKDILVVVIILLFVEFILIIVNLGKFIKRNLS